MSYHQTDLYIAEYARIGIPMLCRLEDFPRVSRLYSPESAPSRSQLMAWYATGYLVHQAQSFINGKTVRRRGRWVNVHQTLALWRVHPGSFFDLYPSK